MSNQEANTVSSAEFPREFEAVRIRYPEIYVIVAPPRSSSTAFARVFWEHPSIGYYSHEPFETTYFRDAPLADAAATLRDPLELEDIKSVDTGPEAEALVVKEMPYQVGTRFPILTELATAPVVFLLRDPRLNISSRMEKKTEVGDDPIFPLVETGWEMVRRQVRYCEAQEIQHLIVSSDDFRNRPLELLPQVFAKLGLDFSEEMLSWRPCEEVEIDNLEGDHAHLYATVLSSSGVYPEEAPPPLEWFPEEGGFRDHVSRCLEIYRELLESPARLRPDQPESGDASER
jgi:hypothetical protein